MTKGTEGTHEANSWAQGLLGALNMNGDDQPIDTEFEHVVRKLDRSVSVLKESPLDAAHQNGFYTNLLEANFLFQNRIIPCYGGRYRSGHGAENAIRVAIRGIELLARSSRFELLQSAVRYLHDLETMQQRYFTCFRTS